MTYQETNHRIVHRFQVTLARDNYMRKDRRYEASCTELSGCTVHAATKAEALSRIRKAIKVWLSLANDVMWGGEIEDLIDDDFIIIA